MPTDNWIVTTGCKLSGSDSPFFTIREVNYFPAVSRNIIQIASSWNSKSPHWIDAAIACRRASSTYYLRSCLGKWPAASLTYRERLALVLVYWSSQEPDRCMAACGNPSPLRFLLEKQLASRRLSKLSSMESNRVTTRGPRHAGARQPRRRSRAVSAPCFPLGLRTASDDLILLLYTQAPTTRLATKQSWPDQSDLRLR
jgi:hypothetical protein